MENNYQDKPYLCCGFTSIKAIKADAFNLMLKFMNEDDKEN